MANPAKEADTSIKMLQFVTFTADEKLSIIAILCHQYPSPHASKAAVLLALRVTGKVSASSSPVPVLDAVVDAEVASSLTVCVIWPCTSRADLAEVVIVASVVVEKAVPVPAGRVELW